MPALILQLTRVGFLILLWLFVLAAIRVIRADLRMAANPRVASRDRPGARHGGRPGPSNVRCDSSAVAAGGHRRIDGRHPHPARRRPGADRPGRGLHAGAGRRLRLDQARPAHPRRRRHVYLEDLGSTNGTYLDRTRVVAPDLGAGRRADPDRPHGDRVAPMSERQRANHQAPDAYADAERGGRSMTNAGRPPHDPPAALRGALRPGSVAVEQPGLRVRRRAAADRRRRHGWARRRRSGVPGGGGRLRRRWTRTHRAPT